MKHTVNLKRFAAVYLMAIFGLVAFQLLLEYFAGIELSSELSFLPTIIAVGDAASDFAKRYDTMPDAAFAWGATAKMMLVEIVISSIFAIIIAAVLIDGVEIDAIIIGMVVAFTIVVYLMSWVLARFFFTFMIKMQLKAKQKQKAA